MDLEKVRQRWIDYNNELIEKFKQETGAGKASIDRLKFYSEKYLIDFESEPDIDPDNKDGGIITIDSVTFGYINSFLGRWYISEIQDPSESRYKGFMKDLAKFYTFLRDNKLYKGRSTSMKKLLGRLENTKKYMKRFKDYWKIQGEKEDEEKYLDLMREWEYEDL